MQNNQTNRSIILNLRKSYFENYIRFIFKTQDNQPICVNREHELGKYLFSRVRYSNNKPQLETSGYPVELILPAHGNDGCRNNFIYYTADDMARINDFIDSTAYLDFRMCVYTGTIDLKIDRKVVISVFSDLVFGEDKFEMLKKDEYRKRKKLFDWIKKSTKEFIN